MKKAMFVLLLVLLIFLCVCAGVLVGRTSYGEHILISYDIVSDETAPTVDVPADSHININTATLEQLMTLPDIGEVLARRIIDYRTAIGAFESVDDLLSVEGIGITTLEQIREHITVGG